VRISPKTNKNKTHCETVCYTIVYGAGMDIVTNKRTKQRMKNQMRYKDDRFHPFFCFFSCFSHLKRLVALPAPRVSYTSRFLFYHHHVFYIKLLFFVVSRRAYKCLVWFYERLSFTRSKVNRCVCVCISITDINVTKHKPLASGTFQHLFFLNI